jgi:hypothetical protein
VAAIEPQMGSFAFTGEGWAGWVAGLMSAIPAGSCLACSALSSN